MKKQIFNIFILVLFIFTICGCGELEDDLVTPEIPVEPETPDITPVNPDNPILTPDNPIEETVEFTVVLMYNKKVFIPEEEITVIWVDEYAQHTKNIDSSGYAKIMLDGEFNVFLKKAPEGYSYNPNIYTANNDNSVVEIELTKLSKISKGSGTELYKEFRMTTTGVYKATIKSNSQKVFYEYEPKKPGYYVVESLVNIYDDMVNPKLDVYTGTFAAKFSSETIDSGGAYKKGGYTKNFKWVIKLAEEQLQNVFTFAVYADTKNGIYPIDLMFSISYEGEYYLPVTTSKLMVAKEAGFKTLDYNSDYQYYNSDGGTGNYYGGTSNGSKLLVGENFVYNEDDGYWYFHDKTVDEYYILCAKITAPCAYYEESLNMIESHGNKNLTVSNGTENYKQFIEIEYAATCNSDGVCYVTMELKEFLQKFSVSQRLFLDGNGFVESTGVYASEEDQWLFACGYYKKVK